MRPLFGLELLKRLSAALEFIDKAGFAPSTLPLGMTKISVPLPVVAGLSVKRFGRSEK